MTIERQAVIGSLLAAALIGIAATGLRAQDEAPPPVAEFQTFAVGPYRVYTDLTPPRLWAALDRLDDLADLYEKQTASFDVPFKGPLNVFLYHDYQDYRAALKLPQASSAGIYTGSELRAIADTSTFSRESIWHVIQHEGFHQVAHRVIARPGQQLPLWVNEGLAEYFGEALWTGTRLRPGAIDAGGVYSKVPVRGGRLGRLQRRFQEGSFRPLDELLTLSPEAWRAGMNATIDYDQVYALVYYLIHGEAGKHRDAFGRYINDVANGRPNLPTFKKHFGRDLDALAASCQAWWLERPEKPTARLHAEIAAETLANVLARTSGELAWASADAFIRTAQDGKVALLPGRQTYLPEELIKQAAAAARHLATWELNPAGEHLVLTATLPDGTRISASAWPGQADLPGKVELTVHEPDAATQPATRPRPADQ